jgi:hypothetical protein
MERFAQVGHAKLLGVDFNSVPPLGTIISMTYVFDCGELDTFITFCSPKGSNFFEPEDSLWRNEPEGFGGRTVSMAHGRPGETTAVTDMPQRVRMQGTGKISPEHK